MKWIVIAFAALSALLFYWSHVVDQRTDGRTNMDALPWQILGCFAAVIDVVLLVIYFIFW